MLEKSLKLRIAQDMRYGDSYDTANAISAYLGIGDCVVGSMDEWVSNYKYKNRKNFYAQYKTFKKAKILAKLEEIELLCQKICNEEFVVVKELLDNLESEIGKIYSFLHLFEELCVQIDEIKNYKVLNVNFTEPTDKSKIEDLILIRIECIDEYKKIYKCLRGISGSGGLCCFEESVKNIDVNNIELTNVLKLLNANKKIICFENDNKNWYLFEEKDNCVLNAIEKIRMLRSNIEITMIVQSIQRVIDERSRDTIKPTYKIINKFVQNTNCLKINQENKMANILISGKKLSNIEFALLQIYNKKEDEYTYKEIKEILGEKYKKSTILKAVYHSPILWTEKCEAKDSTYKLVTHTMINEKQIVDKFIEEHKNQYINNVECDYYFKPVNLKQWNMFDKVSGIGHVEPFLATKNMKVGDKLLLYAGTKEKEVTTGVYAIAEIISEPYVLENSPEDYCNGKPTINAKIIEIDYLNPIINKEQCKRIFKQFRIVHKVSEEGVSLLKEFIDKLNVQFEENIVAGDYKEGAVSRIVVNAFERNPKARAECIRAFGCKCQICGFEFGKVYGEQFENLIHVHHIKPLNEMRKDYIVDPKTDLIPVCPNCHMVLHSRKDCYNPNEIKSILNQVNKKEI